METENIIMTTLDVGVSIGDETLIEVFRFSGHGLGNFLQLR